ncbi:hypothetical protein PMG11_04478 [Penicillium brasilianum]|uniref:HORMA domain-containing protein n=1 Tax=Penicillium brasilianum TaxID=104259 RepID=A0A0F7VCV4_PENBI|nr:hypothetical protein PMG11_04478 [Penicillium brasilianum]
MYVKEIDEFAVVDRLEEEQKELEKEISELEEEKKRLREKIGLLEKAKKQGSNPFRAQAVSTFYKGDREPYLPVHRCLTEVETNMYYYPAVHRVTEIGGARNGMESTSSRSEMGQMLTSGLADFDYLFQPVRDFQISNHIPRNHLSDSTFDRDILPLSSFGVRDLPICFSDEKFCFEEHFLNNGAEPEEAYPLQVGQGRIPMMERNRDKNTDKILDNLENNFVESLVKRELLGIQFLIGRDADHPMEVYETYTISIDYRGKRGPSDRRGEKLDFHDPKEDYKSSVEVKKAILDMFRRIYIVTNRLTTLPEKRCLFFHTFHTPWAPESKNGDDYNLSWDDVLASPTIPGWRRENVTSSFIDTGFYGARLSVTYLDPPKSNDKARNIPIQVPSAVQFRGRRVRDADMEWKYGTEWVDDELDRRAAAEAAVSESTATPKSAAKRVAVDEADEDVSRKKSKTA